MPQILKALFGASRSRWPSPSLDTRLAGPRVVLRVGDPADWQVWRNVRSISRDFLTPWEPTWPDHGLTYDYFCGNLRRHWREWRGGTGYAFSVFIKSSFSSVDEGDEDAAAPASRRLATPPGFPRVGENEVLIGGIALNDVQRGVAQKGTLGYWIGQPYAGRGLMTEAARLVCDFSFTELKLHRVEASCLPRNEPSRRLLVSLGFEQEGYARSYLRINGVWEDHLLWGKCATD